MGVWETDIRDDALQQGAREKAIETARNFLKMNILTPAQISEGTGLSLEEVERLAMELEKAPIPVQL